MTVAARRRDVLHLPARASRAARGARPLSRAHLRPATSTPERFFVTGSRHAGDPDRGAHGGRHRRRGDRADAGLAEHHRRGRGRRRDGAAGARCASAMTAGRSISTRSSPRPVRGRAPSSSTRPPTRPAGRRPATSSRAILAFARERGLWIIADEVYHRFYYDAPAFALLLRRRRATKTASSSSTPSPRTGR